VVESVVGTNLDITESKKQSEIHDRLATAVEQASENIMIYAASMPQFLCCTRSD